LVPQEAPGEFNQGLMELGALVCEPADPRCETCPLLPDCVAGNSPDPTALPEFPPGRATVTVTHVSILLRNPEGHVLIIQRPLHGLWGGLWEFPRVISTTGESPQEAALRAALQVVGLEVVVGSRIGTVKHAVTHHKITLYGFDARLREPAALPQLLECADARWVTPEALNGYGFSSPQTLLRQALETHLAKERAGNLQPVLGFDL